MTLIVDNPILNSPYREPERYWLYDVAGMQRVENGRRPAGYCLRARANAYQFPCSPMSRVRTLVPDQQLYAILMADT